MSPDPQCAHFVSQCFVVICVLLVIALRILVVAFSCLHFFRILRVDLLTFIIVLEVVWTIALDSFLDHDAFLDVVRTEAFSAGKWHVWALQLNTLNIWVPTSKPGMRLRRRARSRQKARCSRPLLLHLVRGFCHAATVDDNIPWKSVLFRTTRRHRSWNIIPLVDRLCWAP